MSKRLVLCCDGTWNTPDQLRDGQPAPTNVAKVALAIAARDDSGREQRGFYLRGVGTNARERVRGGAFGFGLSRDVQATYRFLMQNFEPGDELFFFGFSRGAYTARSTVGFVRKCGILRREHADRLAEAYALYRARSSRRHPRSIEAQLFRRSFAHETPIRFIGVWDTVGALGIPLSGLRLVNLVNRRWQFHDTTLSSTVAAAFQALAIDERRGPFRPAIWQQSSHATDQRLEQVWFAGAHSDVGGGNADPALAEIPLLWMVSKARGCGLAFEPDAFAADGPDAPDAESQRPLGKVVAPDALGRLHNSRTGFYRLLRPFDRDICVTDPDHEWVAASAVERHQKDQVYAPSSFATFPGISDRVISTRAVVQGKKEPTFTPP